MTERVDADDLLAFDALSAADRKLLFGVDPDPHMVEVLYRDQHYSVDHVAGLVWVMAVAESELAHHPRATAWLPPGFKLTGGGARANWKHMGSLLTESHPRRTGEILGWEARAKDHSHPEPVTLHVWAIGIRTGP
jgi:hypothetical protein